MTSISAAMPAYNEEALIGPMVTDVIDTLSAITDDYEVVVVDDGSRDRTAEIVQSMAAENPKVKLVQHETNQGYGAAAYSALTHSTREIIFFTDSDRQFKLKEIHRLLPLLDEADMVVGYRAPRRDPFYRTLYGWGWSALVTMLFGYVARDIDCAFKLLRREVMDTVGPHIAARGATFSAEWLVRAKRAGFRIREMPVTHLRRTAGSPTGARLDVITRAFRELIRFRWQLWIESLS